MTMTSCNAVWAHQSVTVVTAVSVESTAQTPVWGLLLDDVRKLRTCADEHVLMLVTQMCCKCQKRYHSGRTGIAAAYDGR